MNTTNGPFGAGSQLESLSVPGESCWMWRRQTAVGVTLQVRQHLRIDEIAVEGIGISLL